MKITYLMSMVMMSLLLFTSCNTEAEAQKGLISKIPHKEFTGEKMIKTEAQWKSELSDEAYHVLREEGTEPSFSSSLLKNKDKGVYHCGGCGLALFSSETKFKSGTGWPSFYQPI